MTALEFSVTQMLSDCRLGLAALGDEFTTLRAFRCVGAGTGLELTV